MRFLRISNLMQTSRAFSVMVSIPVGDEVSSDRIIYTAFAVFRYEFQSPLGMRFLRIFADSIPAPRWRCTSVSIPVGDEVSSDPCALGARCHGLLCPTLRAPPPPAPPLRRSPPWFAFPLPMRPRARTSHGIAHTSLSRRDFLHNDHHPLAFQLTLPHAQPPNFLFTLRAQSIN